MCFHELLDFSAAGPAGTVPLQQSGTTVGCPKPKQPPQILPKPPSGQPSSGSHTKIATNSRSATSTQHQGTLYHEQFDSLYVMSDVCGRILPKVAVCIS
jgi:hypothetical protein